MTTFSSPVEGHRLAFDGRGQGVPVVLLHGWPGDRFDFDAVVPFIADAAHVVTPDLRGFGESVGGPTDDDSFSPQAQARSIAALITEMDAGAAIVGGYDLGSRVAQTLARLHPEVVAGLVLSPPLPGAGRRLLEPPSIQNFWYQEFHQTALLEQLVDGDRDRVRHYLNHFWTVWSAPGYTPDPRRLDRLADSYARPGALTRSVGYYRTGGGAVAQAQREQPPARSERVAAPTMVLWPGDDPIMPTEWSDDLASFFVRVQVRIAAGAGHFVPVEAPREFADAVRRVIATCNR